MNIQKLKQCIYYRIRLRPVARSIPSRLGTPNDDVWIVTAVHNDGVVELNNIATGHVAKLWADHIHHFDSDPMSETDGLQHGFLTLTAQIFMSGRRLWIEPLPPHMRQGLTQRSKGRSASGLRPRAPRP